MTLQPQITHWFETYIPRTQTVYALEALAATGRVQLDQDLVPAMRFDTAELQHAIRAAEALRQRHEDRLPVVPVQHQVISAHPASDAAAALRTLRHWLATDIHNQRRVDRLCAAQRRLQLLGRCMRAMGGAAESLAELGHSSDVLFHRLYACRAGDPPTLPDDPAVVSETFADAELLFYLVICRPSHRGEHEQALHAVDCEQLAVPDWLAGDPDVALQRIDDEVAALQGRIDVARTAAARHRADPGLRAALEQLAVLHWFLDHATLLTTDGHHCHVTGWTTAADPALLNHALKDAGIEARILFRPQPPGRTAPVASGVGGLARWLAAPFRQFVHMAGTPGPGELDPAPLLALIVPLLFGLMFPDLGHGLVLVAVGALLWQRRPDMRFLVPCGLAAAGFGMLFGETFGLHWPAPAIWFCPLDEPLRVLLLSMVVGAAIILLGLAVSGIEAHWQGRLGDWLWREAPVLVLYSGLLAATLYRPALALAAVALAWYVVGLLRRRGAHPLQRLASGLATLLFSAFELVLNTLSFLRIGAFALAHAGLTHALLEIVSLFDTPAIQVVVLVIGHALVIALEALVVFVQTTRLVLFEFFTRFLHAEGRLMRPLQRPGLD